MRVFMRTMIRSLLILSLFSFGCQSQKEVVHDRQAPTAPQAPNIKNEGESSGTVDGAGGNGVNGRPLESYQIDSRKLVGSYEDISRVFKALEDRVPRLAAVMLHIVRERSWYMIPVALDKIPPFKIGAFFPTDQIALQNLQEIWFDSKLFDGMNQQDQVRILLHEILMGVRLLEFAGDLDKCLAKAAIDLIESTPKRDYSTKRSQCYKDAQANLGSQLDNLFGKKFELTEIDYSNIRYLTNFLLSDSDSLDSGELEAWLATHRFMIFKEKPGPEKNKAE